MTPFFVPGLPPEEAEARYAELAVAVGATVVDPPDRLLSVRFVHGAEEWTATVGERLSGQFATRTGQLRSRRATSTRSAPTREVSDPATVQAVFDVGGSYLVLTDGHPTGAVRDSTWDNPFPVARDDARRVRRFGE